MFFFLFYFTFGSAPKNAEYPFELGMFAGALQTQVERIKLLPSDTHPSKQIFKYYYKFAMYSHTLLYKQYIHFIRITTADIIK